ncbi:MAG: HAMP domain-containing sensor histidine kinase [Chthoniobacteraceae bacterium]
MRLRFPLYGKVLFWFFVNLALVAALAYGFARMQFRVGMEWLLAGPATQRIEAMSGLINADLRERPANRWNEVLDRYHAANGVTFAIFRNDGRQVAGPALNPPATVVEKLRDRRGPPPRNPRPEDPPRQDSSGERRNPPGQGPPARFMYFLRAGEPAKYWAGIHVNLVHDDPVDPRPVTVLIVSDTITGGGMFFDPRPWLWLIAAAFAVSALVWLPIVGGITRAIRRVNTAARTIAEGRFDVRLPAQRRDELGELGASVNTMAAQLGEYVGHQRRLTADVAHELCSPIARMQRALGIVEQRAVPEQAGYIEKLDRELQHMARLVEEVLSFSKAATLPERVEPEDFPLGKLVADVVSREAMDARVEVHVPAELQLRAIREALDRALSNILRNAVRYAAHAGPIEIRAHDAGDAIEISVRDHGPGVPADALGKIFDLFYRPEAARQRTTGGAGLGLAIVKRCIEACGGSVVAANCTPDGLQVKITLSRSR